MYFSCFAPISLYKLSAKEPEAKSVYRQAIQQLGGQYDVSVGSRMEAKCFAEALTVARARQRLHQAADQRLPSKVCDLIDEMEARYKVVPGQYETMGERRSTLARRARLPGGNTQIEIETVLREILGDDFIAYRPTPLADATLQPPAIGAWPMNLAAATVPRKIIKLKDHVTEIGTPFTVPFEVVSGAFPIVGDVFVFAPQGWGEGQIDRVTIQTLLPGDEDETLLVAEFTRPHEIDTMGFTHPFPIWRSTRREALIVVTPAAAQDPEKRRKVNEEMRRRTRSVSVWSIVAGDETSTVEFELGTPCMGFTTLGSVAL